MSYIPQHVINLFRGNINLGVFWRLGTRPALHLWMGVGDVVAGIDSVDDGGTKYLGAGRLQNIPDFELLINGVGAPTDFYLSGVDAAFLKQLALKAPPVQGAVCTIGIAPLDENYQPTTSIIPLWQGTADLWAMEQKPSSDPSKPVTRSVICRVGSGDTSRAKPRLVSFSGPQQRLLSPTDAFCDRVQRYTQTYNVAWPRYT